jgi:cytochrome o ubiquinol oxidase operon protein cyoD
MTERDIDTRTGHEGEQRNNVAPGTPHDSMLSETVSYVIGLVLALALTAISFWVASTSVLWGPGVAVGLVVLAIAQMGIHLVFFLHITSGPDNTNNVLALAFGVLIVFLVMIGTIWIMGHMNANMMTDPAMMNLQSQRG